MLSEETLVAFTTTAQPKEARAFYEDVLGLSLVSDGDHLMVFESGAGRVSVVKGENADVRPGTALGWNVKDLRASVHELAGRGVVFERYNMDQDDLGSGFQSPARVSPGSRTPTATPSRWPGQSRARERSVPCWMELDRPVRKCMLQ